MAGLVAMFGAALYLLRRFESLEQDMSLLSKALGPGIVLLPAAAGRLFFDALMATLNPGDEVIVPVPYRVSYPDIAGPFPSVLRRFRPTVKRRP